MMDLINTLATLEESSFLHEARILLLLNAFEAGNSSPLKGLTKLAKLDFLLRYPAVLERALKAKGYSTKEVEIRPHERYSVESRMVRYRFGPWDHRYRAVLAALKSKGLVETGVDGRATTMLLTPKGSEVAANLSKLPEYSDLATRAAVLSRRFDIGGSALMRFVYATFPEISSFRTNQEIRF